MQKLPSLTLTVPQGIGDIFWIYQRFSPHVETLHFRIACIRLQDKHGDKLPERAKPFVETWPQVGSVEFVRVNPDEYEALAHSKFSVASTLKAARNGFNDLPFACNGHLEAGTRLDAVDPELETRWQVDLPVAEQSNSLTIQDYIDNDQPYLCLYISGTSDQPNVKALGAWDVEQWLTCYRTLCEVAGWEDLPVVLIGAIYDHAILRRFVETGKLLRTTFLIDQSCDQVLHTIQHASAYLGFQSGIGILADAIGTPNLMLYFPMYEKVQHSWHQPGHDIDGTYTAATFAEDPAAVGAKFGENLLFRPGTPSEK